MVTELATADLAVLWVWAGTAQSADVVDEGLSVHALAVTAWVGTAAE